MWERFEAYRAARAGVGQKPVAKSAMEMALDGILEGKDMTREEAVALCEGLMDEVVDTEDANVRDAITLLVHAHADLIPQEMLDEFKARLVLSEL